METKSNSEKRLPIDRYQDINGKVTYKNIRYLQMVDVQIMHDGRENGIACGCNVHFFNKKGVLVGRVYEFLPYERLAKHPQGIVRARHFMYARFEGIKSWAFDLLCDFITVLLKFTQAINK